MCGTVDYTRFFTTEVLSLFYANMYHKSLTQRMLLSKLLWQLKTFGYFSRSPHNTGVPGNLLWKMLLLQKKNGFIWSSQLWKINFKIQQESINQKLNLPDKTLKLDNPEKNIKMALLYTKSKCLQVWLLKVFKFM